MRQNRAERMAAVQRIGELLKRAYGRDFTRGEIEAAAATSVEAIDLAQRAEYLRDHASEMSAGQFLIAFAYRDTNAEAADIRAAVRALSSR